ncbi:MAG: gluconolactonase [Candidatus Rokuibacteriota bacterium]|nr:MAG: gluconolactonase [Candidatus Rokubacteria bacterium]
MDPGSLPFSSSERPPRRALLKDRWRGVGMGGLKMNRLGYQEVTALCAIVVVIMAFGAALNSAASAETLEELCGACKVEVFVKGGKFLEGPTFDQAGNLWVVNIESGWVSKVMPDGKWSDEFNTGGQPQGLKFHKDGRLFGVDRKKGVFIYDPKTKKMSDYVLYYQNENFHGPNDLIFDRQGGLYFTDPWGTSMANPRGAIYYVSPEGKTSRLMDNLAFPNGIALSGDEKILYIGETMRNAIWSVQLEGPGELLVRRARISTYLNGGIGPDGLTLDEKGNVYVAHVDSGEVVVLTPKGKIIGSIKLPEGGGTFNTNVAFGGPQRQTLYITESSQNIIYRVAMKVRGLKLFGDKE